MQITHNCRTRAFDLPKGVTCLVYTDRCMDCGSWWTITKWDGSMESTKNWFLNLFSPKLWIWNHRRRKEIRAAKKE